VRDVVGDFLGGQSVQVDPPNTVKTVELGDGRDQVRASIGWRGPLGGQNEHP